MVAKIDPSYTPSGVNVRLHLLHDYFGPCQFCSFCLAHWLTPSRLYQQTGTQTSCALQSMPVRHGLEASKIAPSCGDPGPHILHGSLGPPESTSQTAIRSVHPFLQVHRCVQHTVHTHTDGVSCTMLCAARCGLSAILSVNVSILILLWMTEIGNF